MVGRHDGGNMLPSQDHHEGLRTLPLNRVECEKLCLDGKPVIEIFPDLTARDITTGVDLTSVNQLHANFDIAFQGPVKVGPFDIPGDLARHFLQMPLNPNGRPNSDVGLKLEKVSYGASWFALCRKRLF